MPPTTSKPVLWNEVADLPEINSHEDHTIYTCHINAWKTEHTKELLQHIKICNDLTTDEHAQVEALIIKFADCFTLSISKVSPVHNATHQLNLPTGTKIPWKVHQQPLFSDKQDYFFSHIDLML
ncbi:hypothetical protein HETIRDRAFT_318686 [Heterobasidion irregulare TC 32-1]|uniref:Uncharacterized protein n=1 Tax=Heterobasidion irregulare (strain TC 32-1) TaxID=747525 RepID=W4K891_HETIT|nr:uncharacterized protein HETIRDRAFT_318686 [Heterobasidion irregulare TC 32-1]ETW81969.1 hypothetical protein HETIRDRAFT_318686 [Heterobasidion irregulare TC 32-1]